MTTRDTGWYAEALRLSRELDKASDVVAAAEDKRDAAWQALCAHEDDADK